MKQSIELDSKISNFIESCLQKPNHKSYLIAVLHKIQQHYGYLSLEHMNMVAHRLQVPTSMVSGVATFYHYFRLKPRGKYAISICLGTACFVKGADKVLEAFETELGIKMGETTPDGLFSLENSRCLGVCALAPVITINERIFSKVTAQNVPGLINKVKMEIPMTE
ncbi:NADH-quinone oxidoreductase subunit NuoE [candidate division KSB1 bacterium]|nr:NADH-quinone oxidoreductase subunit NuoE [candidate division KSB1 bacterium]